LIVKRMQVAGYQCTACSKQIVLDSEGTWCVHCNAKIHSHCVSSGAPCPNCGKPFTIPTELFVFSRRCPRCGKLTAQGEFSECCGERTRWDSAAAYDSARSGIRHRAWLGLVGGLALSVCGLGLLSSVVPLLWVFEQGWYLFLPGVIATPAVAATGIWCLFRAWSIAWAVIPRLRFQ